MKKIFSPFPLWQDGGIALIRVVVGFFMIYHGWEIFDMEKMNEYGTWDVFRNASSPTAMVYTGKAAELIAGILLVLGFLTRVAALVLMLTMLYISFFIGHGEIWYQDQHPFLLVLLGLVFFFMGGGRYSVDRLIFRNQQKSI